MDGAFYLASKAFGFAATPSNAIALLAGLGVALLVLGRPRGGGRLAVLVTLALFACGLGPIGNLLIVPLERRFPAAPEGEPHGIIVLGGGVEDRLSSITGAMELNEAGDRVVALVALARRFPNARLVYTGGTGQLLGASDIPEAEIVRARVGALGLDPARIVFENRSRNTDENARFTADLLGSDRERTWWLVTSAFHMPRSMGCFRRAGIAVTAAPVDFRAGPNDGTRVFATIGEGLRRTDVAAREWMGLLAYRLAGKTDALFPAP